MAHARYLFIFSALANYGGYLKGPVIWSSLQVVIHVLPTWCINTVYSDDLFVFFFE